MKTTTHRLSSFWTLTIFTIVTLCAIFGSRGAWSESLLDQPIQLDITAGTSLEEALLQWGAKTGMQLMMSGDSVSHRTSPAIHGSTRAAAAMDALLSGTGLSYTVEGSTVHIIPATSLARSIPSMRLADSSTGISNSVVHSLGTSDSQPDVGSTGGGDVGLTEVVVTAQKRSEKLMDVPVAVSALSESTLESLNVQSLSDMADYVPGMSINEAGGPGRSQIVIRGISSGYVGGTASMAATLVNDAQIGPTSAGAQAGAFSLDLAPYDLDHVEVLKGPQGTLYGADSMGGLIKYVLREPDLNQFDAKAGADIHDINGSDGPGVSARGSVSLPIVSGSLAVRLSAFGQHDAGYIDNVGTGVDHANTFSREGGRLSLLWEPVKDLTIEATYLQQQMRQSDQTGVTLNAVTNEPVYGPRTEFTYLAQPFYNQVHLAYLDLNWNMGFASLINIASWSGYNGTQGFDLGPVPVPNNPNGLSLFEGLYTTKKFTDEMRLTSRSDQRITWILGAFFTKENLAYNWDWSSYTPDRVLFPPIGLILKNIAPEVYKERSIFGDVTFKLTDAFDITGGVRNASNTDSTCPFLNTGIYGVGISPTNPSPCQTRPYQSKATWLGTASYHPNQNTMFYARVATGYRPGGGCATCGNAALGIPAYYYPDSIVNYEFGMKGEFFDRRLQLDASAFFIDWKDMQTVELSPEDQAYTGNAGAAHSSGLELSSVYQATRELQLVATLAYTDAHLVTDFPSTTPGLFIGKSGDSLAEAPHWTTSLIVDYTHPIEVNDAFLLGGDYRYRDVTLNGYASSTDPNNPPFPMRPQNLFGLYAGMRFNQTTVKLYGLNVFNDRSYTGLLYLYNPARPTMNPVQPRTIGLSIDYKFR